MRVRSVAFLMVELVLNRQGKYEEAEAKHRQSLEGSEKALEISRPNKLTN